MTPKSQLYLEYMIIGQVSLLLLTCIVDISYMYRCVATPDIIETQVAEVDGQLVNFSTGVTTVTLHFKHE